MGVGRGVAKGGGAEGECKKGKQGVSDGKCMGGERKEGKKGRKKKEEEEGNTKANK